MGVQAEGHLQFVNRLGSEAAGEDFVQPFEGVMVALQPGDTGFDGQAGFRGLFHRANPGEAGKVPVGVICLHGNSLISLLLPQKKATPECGSNQWSVISDESYAGSVYGS